MHPQLTLGLRLSVNARFSGYLPGPNQEAVLALEQCARGEGERLIYLFGGSGLGKSHLLQAACRLAGEEGRQAAFIPLHEVSDCGTSLLEGLERFDIVCVDDVEAIAGRRDWERALFDLFNGLHAAAHALVLAAAHRPGALGLELPDLVSRLGWGLVYPLRSLNDEQSIAALRLRAAQLGLSLSAGTGRFLLHRFPRDLPGLFRLLDELDRASLAEQRRLTVPFVKAVLERRVPSGR
jgi:DnaA family protein